MKWLSHTYKCWHYMKNMFQIIQKCAEYASATFFITIFIKRREEEVGNQAMQKLLNFENSNTYSYKWNDLQSYLQELSTTCESKQFDPGSFCRWQNRIIIKSK